MKKIVTSIAVVLLALSTSCRNDAPIVYPEENPQQGIIAKTGFNQVSSHIDSFNEEFGFSFKPSVKGKINSIVVKIPATNNNIRVTLWDVAKKTVIRTEYMAITTADKATAKAINPIELESNKEYLLSINSNDYYDYFDINDAPALYPFAIGNIIVTNCSFIENANQTFPNSNLDTEIFGDISFNFQRTE